MDEWGSGVYSLEEVIKQTEERGEFFRKNKCLEQALYFERLSKWLRMGEKLKIAFKERADIVHIPNGFGMEVISIETAFDIIDTLSEDMRDATEESISQDTGVNFQEEDSEIVDALKDAISEKCIIKINPETGKPSVFLRDKEEDSCSVWIEDKLVTDNSRGNGKTLYHYDVHCGKCGWNWAFTSDSINKSPSDFCPGCGTRMLGIIKDYGECRLYKREVYKI